MIDCREHPNEAILVERAPDNSFRYTKEGLELAVWAASQEKHHGFVYLNTYSRQYTRQRKILGGV